MVLNGKNRISLDVEKKLLKCGETLKWVVKRSCGYSLSSHPAQHKRDERKGSDSDLIIFLAELRRLTP